jgi:hypothetical protein
LWIADAVAAAGCIAWDIVVGRTGAAMGASTASFASDSRVHCT